MSQSEINQSNPKQVEHQKEEMSNIYCGLCSNQTAVRILVGLYAFNAILGLIYQNYVEGMISKLLVVGYTSMGVIPALVGVYKKNSMALIAWEIMIIVYGIVTCWMCHQAISAALKSETEGYSVLADIFRLGFCSAAISHGYMVIVVNTFRKSVKIKTQ